MHNIYRVEFGRPGVPTRATIVPLHLTKVTDTTKSENTATVGADAVTVVLSIRADRKEDHASVIRSAVEALRTQFPYQPFLLQWEQPYTSQGLVDQSSV